MSRRGSTAVLSYDAIESETVFGQHIAQRYPVTDTYIQRGGLWQLPASQQLRLHQDPPAGKSDLSRYADYVGIFELAPEVTYTVTVEGGRLFGQRSGRPKEELFPETPDVFFRKGAPGTRIFERDGAGRVYRILDRKNGSDLIWTKQPS